MPPSDSGPSRQAVGWALLGQAIWLPLLAIAVHDRWLPRPAVMESAGRSQLAAGRADDPPPSLSDLEKAAPPTPLRRFPSAAMSSGPVAAPAGAAAAARPGLVLRSPASGSSREPAAASVGPSAASAGRSAPGSKALQVATDTSGGKVSSGATVMAAKASLAAKASRVDAMPATGSFRRGASPSQLLGGRLTLRDLPAPRGSAMAASSQGWGSWRPGAMAVPRSVGASAVSSPSTSSPSTSSPLTSSPPSSGTERAPRERPVGPAR